jgi:hypothetical protein
MPLAASSYQIHRKSIRVGFRAPSRCTPGSRIVPIPLIRSASAATIRQNRNHTSSFCITLMPMYAVIPSLRGICSLRARNCHCRFLVSLGMTTPHNLCATVLRQSTMHAAGGPHPLHDREARLPLRHPITNDVPCSVQMKSYIVFRATRPARATRSILHPPRTAERPVTGLSLKCRRSGSPRCVPALHSGPGVDRRRPGRCLVQPSHTAHRL